MRILHTADWHLGRAFHRVDLTDAHCEFISHLADVVTQESVDVVLVAGDVFDRALPSVASVQALDRGLDQLRDAGAQVVLISGNHDSPTRLGFGARRNAAAGVHLRTKWQQAGDPVVVADPDGPVAFFALPYLEPALAPEDLPRGEQGAAVAARTHATVTQGLLARAAAARPAGRRNVLLAHGFVAGGRSSDSEREVAVGGVSRIGLDAVAGYDYVALGHLHRPQTLRDGVRYSGSPIAFSFDESDQAKGSWLVDLDRDGLAGVQFVPAPVHRRLSRLAGTFDDLLHSARFTDAEDHFCELTVTDAVLPAGAMATLQQRFPYAVVLNRTVRATGGGAASMVGSSTGDRDLCSGFLQYVRGTEPAEGEVDLLVGALRGADRAQLEPAAPGVGDRPPSGAVGGSSRSGAA